MQELQDLSIAWIQGHLHQGIGGLPAIRVQGQETARLLNPHGLTPILSKRGENELALEDINKEFVAQQVPTPLRSNAQPELCCEMSGAVHSNEPMQVKASGPRTIITRGSIMPMDKKLCDDEECECSGDRAQSQHTMEPLTPSAAELTPDCNRAQVPLRLANFQTRAQAPQAACIADSPRHPATHLIGGRVSGWRGCGANIPS
jgi:hypothetical protein